MVKILSFYSGIVICIFLYSSFFLLGLILVPNGEYLGYKAGDLGSEYMNTTEMFNIVAHRTSASFVENNSNNVPPNSHPWGVFFTVLGTVLLDFDADACQSPARAYLLDVTLPGNIILRFTITI